VHTVEKSRTLLALSKVLDVLGEPSRTNTIQFIQNKYHVSPQTGLSRPISVNEVEDALEELFTIGADLIIQMLEAELQMLDGAANDAKNN